MNCRIPRRMLSLVLVGCMLAAGGCGDRNITGTRTAKDLYGVALFKPGDYVFDKAAGTVYVVRSAPKCFMTSGWTYRVQEIKHGKWGKIYVSTAQTILAKANIEMLERHVAEYMPQDAIQEGDASPLTEPEGPTQPRFTKDEVLASLSSGDIESLITSRTQEMLEDAYVGGSEVRFVSNEGPAGEGPPSQNRRPKPEIYNMFFKSKSLIVAKFAEMDPEKALRTFNRAETYVVDGVIMLNNDVSRHGRLYVKYMGPSEDDSYDAGFWYLYDPLADPDQSLIQLNSHRTIRITGRIMSASELKKTKDQVALSVSEYVSE